MLSMLLFATGLGLGVAQGPAFGPQAPAPQVRFTHPQPARQWAWRMRADGTPGWVWGWYGDGTFWFYQAEQSAAWAQVQAQSQPRPQPNAAANYGLSLGELAKDSVESPTGRMDTNDPDFGSDFYGVENRIGEPDGAKSEPEGPCDPDDPDSCRRPFAPQGGLGVDKYLVPGAIVAAAVLVLLFGARPRERR